MAPVRITSGFSVKPFVIIILLEVLSGENEIRMPKELF